MYIFIRKKRAVMFFELCVERERSTPTETTLLLRITILTFFILS